VCEQNLLLGAVREEIDICWDPIWEVATLTGAPAARTGDIWIER
jgi:hypothetical protein